MDAHRLKWLYLLLLSLIWGSSFILIKKGLNGLTEFELGALRIVLTSLILFAIGYKSLKKIRSHHWKWIALSGFVSSFFPPFLFAMAQTRIDSGVTSILNAVVPLNTIIVGSLVFAIGVSRRQIAGVILGLIGTVLLILGGWWSLDEGREFSLISGAGYSMLVILATIGYAFNTNIIKKYLNDVSALAVTTGSFVFIFIPALIILLGGRFPTHIATDPQMQLAAFYVLLLAIFGTAVAKVVYNRLVQISSPVFASSVTYTMPLVAVGWGLIDGEHYGWIQAVAAMIVLAGVYLGNSRSKR
jgi:drug/metabolite transporter (DMT)-like permease